MDAAWTDKSEIERDLYLAQGRAVPVDIDGTLAGHKPLPSYSTEETDDDYFGDCVQDEEYHSGPDLTLIKQMLDMMRELNTPSDLENEQLEKKINDSKLNPLSAEFVPNTSNVPKSDCSETCSPSKYNIIKLNAKKCKMERNVAVTSIMEALKAKNDSQNPNGNIELDATPELLTRLKSNDMIVDENDVAFANENDKLKLNENTKDNVKNNVKERVLPILAPISMFRRKKVSLIKKSPEIVSPPPVQQYGEQFAPSKKADEYYKTYLERMNSKPEVENVIWAKVQKQIEAIKAQREKMKSIQNNNQGKSGWDLVRLDEHRHHSHGIENCVVCEVLCKKRTIVKEE